MGKGRAWEDAGKDSRVGKYQGEEFGFCFRCRGSLWRALGWDCHGSVYALTPLSVQGKTDGRWQGRGLEKSQEATVWVQEKVSGIWTGSRWSPWGWRRLGGFKTDVCGRKAIRGGGGGERKHRGFLMFWCEQPCRWHVSEMEGRRQGWAKCQSPKASRQRKPNNVRCCGQQPNIGLERVELWSQQVWV